MLCIWGHHNNRQIFLPVCILPISAVQPFSVTPPPIQTQFNVFNALVDTGATTTCITPAVATKVGLTPIGKTQISGVSGPSTHNNYVFHLAFVFMNSSKSGLVSSGELNIYVNPIQGPELILQGAAFDVLLGMDVIGTGSLAVEGNGTYSFSF